MKLQAFIPLVTYPEANSDAVVANATSVAEWLGADLHAVALNPDFPSISNPFSSLLLNVPEMIRDAETASRKRGRHLLDGFQERAAASAVGLTSDELRADVALLAESAASHARYFDVSLLGWESGNDMARTTAESVVFGSGRPAVLLPELSVVGSIDHLMIAWDGSRVAARSPMHSPFSAAPRGFPF